jgi:tetratricopeptide (TPR) repeat protein
LEITYKFTSDDFLDWSAKKATTTVPMPDVTLVKVDADKEEGTKPFQIGVPIDIKYALKLTLPGKYNVRPPVPLNIKRDYATYSSAYRLEGNVLYAEREYHQRLHELPPDRTPDYLAFVAATQSDSEQMMALETTTVADSSAIPDSVKTEDLIDAAGAAAKNDNYPLVESLLKRVLEKEPKHKTARQQLGYALFAQGKFDEAVKVMREQTTLNPYDQYAYSLLGQALWAQQKYDEAEKALRKQLEIAPLDKYAHGNLGLMLVQWRKYKEAVPELDQAISLNPDSEAEYQISLGRAYLNLSENDKAMAAFDRAIKLDPGQRTWNDIAYFLSLSKVNLDKALQYAESSVTELSTDLRNVELDRLTKDDLDNVNALAASWDTLGWVFFQKGDLDSAERYIAAAWRLAEHGEVGYHLGQIYEKRGKIAEATNIYALASIGMQTVPEAQESLERLLGKTKAADKMVQEAQTTAASRTIELGVATTNVKGATEARFFVSLVPGPNRNAQVADVKFITGDEKLKPLASMLKTANYQLVFPDDKITKIIRRGTLSCLSSGNRCTFIMMSPDYVPLD